MSRTVDERVVSMQFDNRDFEKNVNTSMKSLDSLKDKLRFEGIASGMSEISKAIKNQTEDLKKMELQAQSAGFRWNDVLVKMLSRMEYSIAKPMADKILNTFKDLTVTPLKTGLTEYETQLNAVQTILANTKSKGSTLDDVNNALDTLNKYADKTIYNFTEMTRNIGTFTAAGVDLETSVSAIQGIANLAAMSGSTSQQASTAMYQLSQALSTGTVRLMDWNSVVNAGMGGEVFQNALKETARVHGVAIDDIIKKQGSFRESLSEGWLTSEILTETLQHFTMAAEEGSDEWNKYLTALKAEGYSEKQAKSILEMANTAEDAATKVKTFTQLIEVLKESAQSGWAQSWETIIGDFEKAKSLWTMVSDFFTGEDGVITKSAEKRNNLLKGALSSGWDLLLAAGIPHENSYINWIKNVAGENNTAFTDILSKYETFQEALPEALKEGAINSDTFKEALNGLTIEFGKAGEAGRTNLGVTEEQYEALVQLNDQIQNGKLSMEDFTKAISKASGRDLLIESFKNIKAAVDAIIAPLKEAWAAIFPPKSAADRIKNLYSLLEKFRSFTASLKISEETADKLRRTFQGLFAIVDMVISVFKGLFDIVKKLFGFSGSFIDALLTITACIGDFFTWLHKTIEESSTLKEFFTNVSNGLTKVHDKLVDLWEQAKHLDFGWLWELLQAIVTFAKVLFGPIITQIKAIGQAFKDAFNGEGYNLQEIMDFFLKGGITAALIVFGKKFIGWIKTFKEGKNAIVGTFKEILSGIAESLTGLEEQALKIKYLETLSKAILILVGSLVVLSMIDRGKLITAVVTLITVIGLLLKSMQWLTDMQVQDPKKLTTLGKTLTYLSAALLIAAFSIKKIGALEWDEWGRGLIGMSFVLATLIGCLWLMKKMNINGGVRQERGIETIMKLTRALLLVALTLKLLAGKDWASWGRGLIGMVAALTTLIGCAWLIKTMKINDTKGVNKLVALSLALVPVAFVLRILGKMDWDEFGIAITAMGSTLAILMGALWLTQTMKLSDSKGIEKIFAMTAVLLPLALILKLLATMSWRQLAVSLTAMGSALAILTGSLWILQVAKVDGKGVFALLALCPVLMTIAGVMKVLGTMSWGDYFVAITAMGSAIGVLIGAMAIMNKLDKDKTLTSAAGFAIMAASIRTVAISLMMLGGLKASTIIKGVGAIASTILVLAAGVALLGKYEKKVLIVAGAIAILGAGCSSAGLGLIFAAHALDILIDSVIEGGPAFVQGIVDIITAVVSTIPLIAKKIGEGFVEFCGAIAAGAPALKNAFIALIDMLLSALIESSDKIAESIVVTLMDLNESILKVVPVIVEGIGTLIVKILELLVKYVPQFVDKILDLIIAVTEATIARVPELNATFVKLITVTLSSLVEAFKQVDPNILVEGILVIGALSVLMVNLALLAALAPAAVIGAVWMGVVITELAFVLAGVGALFGELDGISSAIRKSADILGALGTAIGQFLGGIAGGITEGISGSLPNIGKDLSDFMENIKPFLEGLKLIDFKMVVAAASLVLILTAITVANALESVTAFLTFGSSMKRFGKNLSSFGQALVDFAYITNGINADSVKGAAEAGVLLCEMASKVPLRGGILDVLLGGSLGSFGANLFIFGRSLADFSEAVKDIDPTSVTAGATAGTLLAEMASKIPAGGGLLGLIMGGSLGEFGVNLPIFGDGLMAFALAVSGIEDYKTSMAAATEAGGLLGEMAEKIPTTGGLLGLFAGDNKLGDFGVNLAIFGAGLRSFSRSVNGMKKDDPSIEGAADAAELLSGVAEKIPTTGGFKAWFCGDNSLGKFGVNAALFGIGLKEFAENVDGIEEYSDSITAAVPLVEALSGMADSVQVSGGLKSFWSGDADLGEFSRNLDDFARGIKRFAIGIDGIEDYSGSITTALPVVNTVMDIAKSVPSQGGLKSIFTGGTDLTGFTANLLIFGIGVKQFAKKIGGITEYAADVSAAKSVVSNIISMVDAIPLEGGFASLILGDSSIDQFSDQLPGFARGIMKFAKKVEGINEYQSDVNSAKTILNTIIGLFKLIPNEGGVAEWFNGGKDIGEFGDNLVDFGKGLIKFAKKVEGIDEYKSDVKSTKAIVSIISEIAALLPSDSGLKGLFSGSNDMDDFADNLVDFGKGLMKFAKSIKNIGEYVDAASSAKDITANASEMIKNIPTKYKLGSFPEDIVTLGEGIKKFAKNIKRGDTDEAAAALKSLTESINSLSTDTVHAIKDSFGDSKISILGTFKDIFEEMVDIVSDKFSQMNSIIAKGMMGFNTTIQNSGVIVKNTFKGVIDGLTTTVSSDTTQRQFRSAGSFLVQGFANGINSGLDSVRAKANAIAMTAKTAINNALGIQSPSKELYKSGMYTIDGYVNALSDYAYRVYDAGAAVGEESKAGFNSIISRISNAIDSDMDTNPTIRPVLDLSDVNNGLNTMNGMFDFAPSMGVMARVNSINSSMNKNQNGGNSDVVSAINGLKDSMKNTSGDTYNINGVTYGDGSEIQSAIETIVRAIVRERRS